MCRGEGMGKEVPVPATMTEQTNTFRSTNNYHGKLTGVNLVFHQWAPLWAVSIRMTFPSYYLCCSA